MRTRSRYSLIFFSFIFCSITSFGAQPSWEELAQAGKYAEAKRQVASTKESFGPFYIGIIAFKSGDWPLAVSELTKSIKNNKEVSDYAYFFRGKAYMETKAYKKAREDFQRTSQKTQLDYLKKLSFFYEAEALRSLKQWVEAEKLYGQSKKRLKGTEYYASVLWGQLISQTMQKKKRRCRYAKELFLKYPNYEKTVGWGIYLAKNKIKGHPLGCLVTFQEQKLRLKRMLWAGLEDEAHKAIKLLQKKATARSKYDVDEIYVQYLLHEGYITEAISVLDAYKVSEKNNYKYWNLRGKSYAKNQQKKESVAAYYKASKVAKSSRHSGSSLFQAAFLSYYFQDYDDAIQKFSEYKKKYPGTHNYANAYWYIGWSKYLKKDYVGAGQDFIYILKKKKSKRRSDRRRWRAHRESKVKYWLAMTWMRQGLTEKAINFFTDLTHDDSMGYYSVAAYQRLRTLSSGRRGLAQLGGGQKLIHENWWLPEATAERVKRSNESDLLGPVKDPFEDQADTLLGSEGRNVFRTVASATSEQLVKDIKSLYLNTLERSVQRARLLTKVAETRFAHREILEVEGRRLNEDQRRWVLKAHEAAKSYNRSVILASYFYANNLIKLGVHHGADYWRSSYPRAYEPVLTKYTSRYKNVPPEFVWSIMRAETIYRPTAISPVGARGLMQVMPKTGRKLSALLGEPFDFGNLTEPEPSIRLGSYYLHRLLNQFQGKLPLAAAAYNGGPHRVHAWMHYFGDLDMDEFIEHIPYKETRGYTKRVTKYFAIYNLLYHKNTDSVAFLTEPLGFQLEGSIPTREIWETM